jgi:tetratricopeptide (TPR) repeat protein
MEPTAESNLKEFLVQNNLINSQEDLISLATALIDKAYKKQLKDKTLSALAYLKQTEEILEILGSQGKPTRIEIIQVTLNNIAACYQRLGDMEKCASYLEACSFNCYRNPVHTTIDAIALDIKQLKFHANLLIQLAVVLSNLKKHKEALEKATHAQNLTHLALRTTIEGHKVLLAYYKKNKQNKNLKQQIFQTIAEGASKTLIALNDYLSTNTIPKTEEMRSVLGVKTFSSWIYEFSISNIIVIQPLTIAEITEKAMLQAEFTKDYLLFKIALHCASLFCIATETKHLRTSQPLSVAQRKQS